MSFLSPFFLFAVAAVGLPLIIHFLNLKRPQKVAFSTLAFFKELQKTTIRKIRIKRWLLLALRLLAIICLALVLARPFLPPGLSAGGSSQAPALNAIILDNSISMNRIGQKGPLFEQALEIIRDVESASKDSDRFIFQVSNGEEEFTNIIGHSQLQSRLEEASVISAGNYMASRTEDLIQILEDAPYENKRLFIITDGQLSQLQDLNELPEISRNITATLFNLGEVDVQNTVIKDVQSNTSMIGAGLPIQISVDIQNEGNVPVSNQFVTVEFNEQVVGQYSVSMGAGETQTFGFEVIPSGTESNNGQIIVEGDEFTDDNAWFFTIQVPDTRNVLWVNEADQTVDQLLYTEIVLEASGQNDAQLKYEQVTTNQLESVNLRDFDAIILDGVATIPEYSFDRFLEFVQNGGGIVFLPSEQGNINNYNDFLRRFNAGTFEGISGDYASFEPVASATGILEDHPVFEGLFERAGDEDLRVSYPDVFYYFKLRPSTSPGGFNIFTLNTNDPLIREKRFGDGKLIISGIGTDPGWSNFPVNPLFAPFYYRSLMYAASSDQGGFVLHELGEPFNWVGKLDNATARIEIDGDEIVPETEITAGGTRLQYPAEGWAPGWITLSDGEKNYQVAMNVSRGESDFQSGTKENLPEVSEKFTFVDTSTIPDETLQSEIIASGFGREIWNWFMWAGLFFLILETLVSTFYKTETTHQ